MYSLLGLGSAVAATVLRPIKKDTKTSAQSSEIINEEDQIPSTARLVVGAVLVVVQMLLLAIVLCPLVVLYVLGLYLSAGISLWRLIQHDYGNPDGGANLKPALNVLYSLAVAQGVIYGYRSIYDLAARTGLVEDVAEDYSLETDLVSEYLEEMVEGCMKDPSFARGRNLVTYAVELLMESKSRYGYISGVQILGTVTLFQEQSGLLKQLLTRSASFSHVVQQLVETFGPTSPYSTEIRVPAARIVAIVAGNIRLEQFPQAMMIECMSSLLDTFEEYNWRPERYRRDTDQPKAYERDWLLDDEELRYSYHMDAIPRSAEGSDRRNPLGYRGLVVEGLRILRKLAANEDNCRVISNTEGLLSKTVVHLTSNKLHEDHHDEWYIVAEESLEFVNRLVATLGGTETTKLTSEISSSSQAIMRTLMCHKCGIMLKRKAAQVLLHLSLVDMPGGNGSIIFVWILLHIFLLPDYHFVVKIRGATHLLKKSSYTKRLAGDKMQAMISSITGATDKSMLPSVGYIIGSLARTVVGAENNACRIHAARVLRDLCGYYTKDDEYLKVLKKAMASVMEELLKEIVHWQVVTEANKGSKVLLTEGPDLEQGGYSHDNNNGQESSTTHQQEGDQGIQLQEALINLCWCWETCWRWIWLDEDQKLTGQFNEMAAKICSGQAMPEKTFRTLVDEARKRASRLAAVHTS